VSHRFHIVDVFAESLYAGNTLAVVRDAADLDSATMQAIAREFGFSETTFVVSDVRDAAGDGVRVRIFTPSFEMPFAGHPTIGTAWVIREHLLAQRPAEIVLALGVGRVPVAYEADASGELGWLTAPPVTLGAQVPADEIAPIVGLAPSDLDPALPVQRVAAGPKFTIVPVRSREALARARLNLDAFAADESSTGLYCFVREAADPANQIRARMFFEAAGAREDPATGSATACFGAYLLAHGVYGKSLALRIEQGFEMGRPSLLHLDARTQGGAARIRVGGRVIESARGELL
jgi:trans-2,3-dihydro-3-hydroxyanthranilate isomerase